LNFYLQEGEGAKHAAENSKLGFRDSLKAKGRASTTRGGRSVTQTRINSYPRSRRLEKRGKGEKKLNSCSPCQGMKVKGWPHPLKKHSLNREKALNLKKGKDPCSSPINKREGGRQ